MIRNGRTSYPKVGFARRRDSAQAGDQVLLLGGPISGQRAVQNQFRRCFGSESSAKVKNCRPLICFSEIQPPRTGPPKCIKNVFRAPQMQNQRTPPPEFGTEIVPNLSIVDFQQFSSPARPKIAPRRNLVCTTAASKRQPDDSQRPDIISESGFGAAPRFRTSRGPGFVAWRADLGPARCAKSVSALFRERVLCESQEL